MRVHVGTSGFSYDAWKGHFYPAGLPASRFLKFYGERLSTVEINNTFYRAPTEETLLRWAADVPDGFSFALKASRFLTYGKKLADPAEPIARFWGLANALGEKRGPILVQLPPNMEKDVARLEAFLALLPDGHRAALEFRHPSWFDDEVAAALRAHGAALVYSEGTGDDGTPLAAKLVPTAEWGYLRLRREAYDDVALAGWAKRLREQPWTEAWVYFKHEATGPMLATRLTELLA